MAQVRVTEGVLEGELVNSDFGEPYYSFKGIPYAEPPLGDLRFKAPLPPKPWTGVRSAKTFGSPSLQYGDKGGYKGSEDCLYLNVYTPDISPKGALPVMVWIHGGAFYAGAGDSDNDFYGPEFLVKQDVILVTINYRLGALGFLCLDTIEVPGNAGMKDQVQAIRWVQENITSFGGDPQNVTIFGDSAGGASVNFHLISPMTKGLFNRAISQSGVSPCDWAQVYKPRERAFALGRKLGLYTDDVQELYKFLKDQPAESLITTEVPILISEKISEDINLYFNIVNEKQFGNQERFFYGNDLESFKHGIHEGVDFMTGYTSDEGVLEIGTTEKLQKKLELANNYLEYFVPKRLALTLPIDQKLEVGKKIKDYYFKKNQLTVDDWVQLVKFYTMSLIIYWMMQVVKLCAISRKGKLYLYKFSCKSERNIMGSMLGPAIPKTEQVACHGDDLLYLFNAKAVPTKLEVTSPTYEIVERVTKLWTNFAKYGDPTPDNSLGVHWEPYSLKNEAYLDIGNILVPGTKPDNEELEFWEEIYKEYGDSNNTEQH